MSKTTNKQYKIFFFSSGKDNKILHSLQTERNKKKPSALTYRKERILTEKAGLNSGRRGGAKTLVKRAGHSKRREKKGGSNRGFEQQRPGSGEHVERQEVRKTRNTLKN